MSLRICSVVGCERKHFARTWCYLHYCRWRKHGDVLADVPLLIRNDDRARFEAKVDKGGPNGCWVWQGSLTADGYGRFSVSRRETAAHRFAFSEFVGPIPDGLQIDHLCRNRACVNPAHLEPVTVQENQRRGFSVSGNNARKTHCNNDHEFTAENTYVHPTKGQRDCRACRAAATRRRNARRRAA